MYELSLSEGWQMVPEVSTRPLALIKFSRGTETQRARFDVDKLSFIDMTPAPVSTETRQMLVKRIIEL